MQTICRHQAAAKAPLASQGSHPQPQPQPATASHSHSRPQPATASHNHKQQKKYFDGFGRKDKTQATEDLRRISTAHLEVKAICFDFKFPGRGQRDTPVTDAKGIVDEAGKPRTLINFGRQAPNASPARSQSTLPKSFARPAPVRPIPSGFTAVPQ